MGCKLSVTLTRACSVSLCAFESQEIANDKMARDKNDYSAAFGIFNVARYSSLWKGSLTLYTGRAGHMEKIGEYVARMFSFY